MNPELTQLILALGIFVTAITGLVTVVMQFVQSRKLKVIATHTNGLTKMVSTLSEEKGRAEESVAQSTGQTIVGTPIVPSHAPN